MKKSKTEKIKSENELELELSNLGVKIDELEKEVEKLREKGLINRAKKVARFLLVDLRRKVIPKGMRKRIRGFLIDRGISFSLDPTNVDTIKGKEYVKQKRYPNSKPLASVIITSYNYGELMLEAVHSLEAQTFQDFELIIVDDKSTDETTQSVLNKLQSDYKIIYNKKNVGPGAARNVGAKIAKGKYICFLDADDTFELTYLEKAVYALETFPSIDVIYTHVNKFGVQDSKWHLIPYGIEHFYWNNQITNNAVHKLQVWKKVGGFAEDRNLKFEDWDYWMKVAKTGFQGKLIPEFLFNYRRHSGGINKTARSDHAVQKESVQNAHKELSNRPFVMKVKMSYKNQIAKDPLVNLIGRDYPNREIKDTVAVISREFKESGKLLKKVEGLVSEGKNVFVIALIRKHSEPLLEQFGLLTPYVYAPVNYVGKSNIDKFANLILSKFGVKKVYYTSDVSNIDEIAGERELATFIQ